MFTNNRESIGFESFDEGGDFAAWIRFDRLSNGSVACDKCDEPVLSPENVAQLVAWLTEAGAS